VPLRLLIDECLSPVLVDVANQHGFEAHHVVYRGWQSRKDPFLRAQLLEGEFTLVTNNWRDFRPMLEHAGLHPGAIILPNAPRDDQIRLFDLALRAARILSDPPDLMNTVLEVDLEGTVRVYDLPKRDDSDND
jgi:predicted nuclease of predicted toxin-antitoxin system